MTKTINLKLEDKNSVIDGKSVDYIQCTAVVNGIELKFYPKDSTAKTILKNYLKEVK